MESLTRTNTMEYYSATKKNEITPFAAAWKGFEMIILSEASQTENRGDIFCPTAVHCFMLCPSTLL